MILLQQRRERRARNLRNTLASLNSRKMGRKKELNIGNVEFVASSPGAGCYCRERTLWVTLQPLGAGIFSTNEEKIWENREGERGG